MDFFSDILSKFITGLQCILERFSVAAFKIFKIFICGFTKDTIIDMDLEDFIFSLFYCSYIFK
jgi:hypothetical protein